MSLEGVGGELEGLLSSRRTIRRMPSQLTDEDVDDIMKVNVKSAL